MDANIFVGGEPWQMEERIESSGQPAVLWQHFIGLGRWEGESVASRWLVERWPGLCLERFQTSWSQLATPIIVQWLMESFRELS